MKIDYDVGDAIVYVGRTGKASRQLGVGLKPFRVGQITKALDIYITPWGEEAVDVPERPYGMHQECFRKLPKAPEHEADFIRRIAKPKERVRDREEV